MAPKMWNPSPDGGRREGVEKTAREAEWGRRERLDDREAESKRANHNDSERSMKHHLMLGGGKIFACPTKAESVLHEVKMSRSR